MADQGITHELKTDGPVFKAVAQGRKTFEIRKDDRSFCVGDTLRLRETVHTGKDMSMHGMPLLYTGAEEVRTVSHILRGPQYGLADGWVIMSLEPKATPPADAACQHDTNGDGDCGRKTCAKCHPQYQPKPADAAMADDLPMADYADVDLERIIEKSDGHWREDVFCVDGPSLMKMLNEAASLCHRPPHALDAALIGKLRHQLAQVTEECAALRARPQAVAEVTDSDAPVYYGRDEANAWANGYMAARDAMLAASQSATGGAT